MITETIPVLLDGQRIDRCVALIADCTRSEASAAIEDDMVTLDGEIINKSSQRVSEGQEISISQNPTVEPVMPAAQSGIEFEIRYQDEHLAVIDKPAGLVVHPGAGNADSTLVNGLLERFPDVANVGEPMRPGIVHRLDKGTSGLMLVALSDEGYAGLTEQLQEHLIQRQYTTLVWGHLETARGSIDAPIGRSKRNPQQMTVVNGGRDAITHYEVIASFIDPFKTALLRCTLETGRTHQIRVHLRSIGRPVVGDRTYGGARKGVNLLRPFLHSSRIQLKHPVTDALLEYESELPEDLAEFRAQMGN